MDAPNFAAHDPAEPGYIPYAMHHILPVPAHMLFVNHQLVRENQAQHQQQALLNQLLQRQQQQQQAQLALQQQAIHRAAYAAAHAHQRNWYGANDFNDYQQRMRANMAQPQLPDTHADEEIARALQRQEEEAARREQEEEEDSDSDSDSDSSDSSDSSDDEDDIGAGLERVGEAIDRMLHELNADDDNLEELELADEDEEDDDEPREVRVLTAAAKAERINAMRVADELPSSLALRYSRSCFICTARNPLRRAVLTKCGHMVCAACAEQASDNSGKLECPFCRRKTGYVKIFEDLEEAPQVRQAPADKPEEAKEERQGPLTRKRKRELEAAEAAAAPKARRP